MTHFKALVNVGVPPLGITKKAEAEWVSKRLEFIINPYDENLEVYKYIYMTRKELKKEMAELGKQQKNDPDSYVTKNHPEADFDTMTVAEFATYWHGSDSEVDKSDNILTTCNPRGRWDWYEIGGRWKDSLLNYDKERVDICQIKNLDFNGLRGLVKKYASEDYGRIVELVVKANNKDEKAISDLESQSMFGNLPHIEYTEKTKISEVVESFDRYVDRVYAGGHFEASTYIDIYGWHTEKIYGWFGQSSGGEDIEHDKLNYAKAFEAKIKGMDLDTYLIVIDFHV